MQGVLHTLKRIGAGSLSQKGGAQDPSHAGGRKRPPARQRREKFKRTSHWTGDLCAQWGAEPPREGEGGEEGEEGEAGDGHRGRHPQGHCCVAPPPAGTAAEWLGREMRRRGWAEEAQEGRGFQNLEEGPWIKDRCQEGEAWGEGRAEGRAREGERP